MASTGRVGGNANAAPNAEGALGSVKASKVNKKAAGMRTDEGWKHCVSVDGGTRNVKCNYCAKEFTGGVYRLKHHLAGTADQVAPCRAVPEDIFNEMLAFVGSLQEKHLKKASEYEVEATAPLATTGIANIYKRKAITQITINNVYKKNLREEACQDIALFFYNNAIPFNVANSEEYKKMFESVARHGLGFKPPSYHEVRVKYLKLAVVKTNHSLE